MEAPLCEGLWEAAPMAVSYFWSIEFKCTGQHTERVFDRYFLFLQAFTGIYA